MIPALVQWEISDRCNYHCPHCYHIDPSGQVAVSEDLSDEKMWEIAHIIVENKLFFVTFTGGEPLVRKDLLIDIASFLFREGVILSLNTNLALMDIDTLERLKVHRMLISCPSIDVDVYRETTGNGNYMHFEKKLRMVIDAGKSIAVNMVVSKTNKHLVRQTAQRMAKLGVKKFAATPTSVNALAPDFSILLSSDEVRQVIEDLIWAYEEFEIDVDIMESIPKCIMPQRAFDLELPFIFRSCHAGKSNGTISTQGDIRPCSHNPLTFGNILNDKIGDVWDQMHNWRETSGNIHKDCLGCDVFNYCGGGCRVDAAVREQQLDAAHPYMTEILTEPKVKPLMVHLTSDKMIRPARSFQSRKEGDGWLVAPGNPRSIIHVNEQLYRFLVATREQVTVTVGHMAQNFGVEPEDEHFRNVLISLVRKKFFVLG